MTTELEDLHERLRWAARQCSPSALPDLRQRCIERAAGSTYSRWWDQYPEGHLVALAYRVFAIVNEFDDTGWTNTYELPGEELPRGVER